MSIHIATCIVQRTLAGKITESKGGFKASVQVWYSIKLPKVHGPRDTLSSHPACRASTESWYNVFIADNDSHTHYTAKEFVELSVNASSKVSLAWKLWGHLL